jgi:hypothetical protein
MHQSPSQKEINDLHNKGCNESQKQEMPKQSDINKSTFDKKIKKLLKKA